MLEDLAAKEYGLPYHTPGEKALVREIYVWELAEYVRRFIVRKHYRKGGGVPVLTTGDFHLYLKAYFVQS